MRFLLFFSVPEERRANLTGDCSGSFRSLTAESELHHSGLQLSHTHQTKTVKDHEVNTIRHILEREFMTQNY